MKHKLDEYIQQITTQIDKEKTDATSMDKLGDQQVDLGQHSKAQAMFIGSNQHSKAISQLQEHNIDMDDDTVRKQIPNKDDENVSQKEREQTIRIIAKRLKQQKKTSMAANQYLEIGETIKAQKCLINEGNIEKG